MFPRRRTDQVYATLQQVQRRITEQSGGPTSVSTPAGMQPPVLRTPASGNPTPGLMPVIRTGLQPSSHGESPPLPPLLPPGHAAHQRYSVMLSGTLASLLLVCWIGSLAVAILITYHISRQPLQMPAEPPTRSSPVSDVASSEPQFKLVVRSQPRASADVRREFSKDRDDLNTVMRGADAQKKGWQPWFEVEEGINGSLQLVFAKQGVNKTQWSEFFRLLTRNPRYAKATWMEVR